MDSQSHTDCPKWVEDEQSIRILLQLLLSKIDRNVKPTIRINQKTLPELFDFNNSDTLYLWSLIERLETDYRLITIKRAPSKQGNEIYEKAQVRLNQANVAIVRKWINQPEILPYFKQWITAVDGYSWDKDQKQFVMQHPLVYPGKTAEQVVVALRSIKISAKNGITLRSLSAKCFWADSKFLDHRIDYIAALFPSESANIKARQLLVNAKIPNFFNAVLLIENQDTFLSLAEYIETNREKAVDSLNNLAIVYCAGFRGSASRIRNTGNTVFSLLNQPTEESKKTFIDWWELKSENNINVYFWGDLDFSGMSILATLRNTFPKIEAWKPGYHTMLNYHDRGVCHPMSSANKENQKAPESTGSHYADNALLPVIRRSECFVDQEVVNVDDLVVLHNEPSVR